MQHDCWHAALARCAGDVVAHATIATAAAAASRVLRARIAAAAAPGAKIAGGSGKKSGSPWGSDVSGYDGSGSDDTAMDADASGIMASGGAGSAACGTGVPIVQVGSSCTYPLTFAELFNTGGAARCSHGGDLEAVKGLLVVRARYWGACILGWPRPPHTAVHIPPPTPTLTALTVACACAPQFCCARSRSAPLASRCSGPRAWRPTSSSRQRCGPRA